MTSIFKKSILKIALLTAGLFAVFFAFSLLPAHAENYDISVYITNPEGGTVSYNGMARTSGSYVSVSENSLAIFNIEPAAGYKVGSVKYTGGTLSKSGTLYTTPAVTSDGTIYITFEQQNTFNVKLSIGDEGVITDTNGVTLLYDTTTVTEGESFEFCVVAASGYGVKSVSYAGTDLTPDAAGVYSFTPKTSGTLYVRFAEHCEIEFSVGVEGIVTDTEGNVLSGSTIEVVKGSSFRFLVDTDEGYGVKSASIYYGSAIKKLSPNPDGSYTINNLNSSCVVYIDFQLVYSLEIVKPPEKCNLVVKCGAEQLSTGKQDILRGSTINLSTSTDAGTGYIFSHYLVTKSGLNSGTETFTEKELELPITTDTVIEAVYKKVDAYTITIITTGGGTITQTGGLSVNQTNIKVNRGDSVTFTISPDANYKLKSIQYSGVTLEQNGNHFTTEPITANQTLTVEFKGKSDNVEGIEVTADGTVVTVKSLDEIEDLFSANEGNILRVPVGEGTLSAEMLYQLQGKNIWLDLVGDGYSWNLNGNDVVLEKYEPADIAVSLRDQYATASVTKLSSFSDKIQINFNSQTKFPFKATLNVNVGTKYFGKHASLFKVDMTDFSVKYISSSEITPDGNAAFTLDEGGNYIAVISDEAVTDEEINSITAGTKIDTGERQLVFSVALLFILAALGGLIYYAMAKFNKTK